MRLMYNAKHCYAICLKFVDKFLPSLTKLVLEAKASMCSTIKENLLLSIPSQICKHIYKAKHANKL